MARNDRFVVKHDGGLGGEENKGGKSQLCS